MSKDGPFLPIGQTLNCVRVALPPKASFDCSRTSTTATKIEPEIFGAYLSSTSKTRHGIRALSQNTLGRYPPPARSTTPITGCVGWTPPKPSTSAFIKTGTPDDEDAEPALDEEGAIKAPSSVSEPSSQSERRH